MKPFWMSKTFWVNVLALIAAVSTSLGWDLGLTPEVQATLLAAILAVLNIVLRAVTNTGVTLK